MSLFAAPISVRLVNAQIDVHIEDDLSNLKYRSAVPGGFASAELTFAKPINVRRAEVAPYTRVIVSDKRSGDICWQGEIQDPGAAASQDREAWQFTAMGPSARAGDIAATRHYMESDPAAFDRTSRQVAAATVEVGPTPDGTSDTAVVVGLPGGTVLGAGVIRSVFYDRLVDSLQQVGGVGYSRVAGKSDGNYQIELAMVADDGTPATETPVSQNWSTAAAAVAAKVVGTDWTVGMDTVRLTVRRSGGATTIADDASWGGFYNLYVAARRRAADGSFVTNSDHAVAYVTGDEVFADLVGSGLLPFDGSTASIDASSYHIDQLAYVDGVTPQQILDDVLALEGGAFWAAWEGSPARCEWTTWPTTSAYVVGVDDGYEAPSSSAELFDQVMVRWVDGKERQRTLYAEELVNGILPQVGVHRRGYLDLTADAGSANNAARMAANFLTDHAYPPNGGTVTIARPVLNWQTGAIERPHQVRPGRIATILGIEAYPDALNPVGRDGRAAVRMISTEYDAATDSVSCELDSYSRALARSLRRANRRRRGN